MRRRGSPHLSSNLRASPPAGPQLFPAWGTAWRLAPWVGARQGRAPLSRCA
ncbi:hypothetical protein ATKI12_0712 [Kitasatospora sp. Ki12]